MVKVGDRMFHVEPGPRGQGLAGKWVVVTKIGRRWAEFQAENRDWRHKEERFDIETMRVDGGGFGDSGRVYASEEDWRENTRLQVLWRELRKRIDHAYSIPPGVTQVGILKAADALGIKLDAE